MVNFLEVTEGKRKILISTSEIATIIQAKKGYAIIFLKQYYRPWLSCYNSVICTNEPYETVCTRLSAAILAEVTDEAPEK